MTSPPPRLPPRPHLFGEPIWQENPSLVARDRDRALELDRRYGTARAAERKALNVRPADAITMCLSPKRRPLTVDVFAVLGEWRYATAHQIAEHTNRPVGHIHSTLWQMFSAGWVSYCVNTEARNMPAGGVHEFWRLSDTFDVDWFLKRFSVAETIFITGGNALTPAALRGARHDLFAVDAMLNVAASGAVTGVIGPRSSRPEALIGEPGAQMDRTSDTAFVTATGALILVEHTIHSDGGPKRLAAYLQLLNRHPTRFFLVWLDSRPADATRTKRFEAETTVATALNQATLLDTRKIRSRMGFATWNEWFPNGNQPTGTLPVRIPASDNLDLWTSADALTISGPGHQPSWLPQAATVGSTPLSMRTGVVQPADGWLHPITLPDLDDLGESTALLPHG